MRKLNAAGKAMCSICNSTITYGSSGKKAFLKHSKNKQPFMCRIKAPEARKFDIFIIKMPKIFAGGAAPLQPPLGAAPLEPHWTPRASSQLSATRWKFRPSAWTPLNIPVFLMFMHMLKAYHTVIKNNISCHQSTGQKKVLMNLEWDVIL